MGMSFIVDVSNVSANLSQFPSGVYPAQVKEAKLEIAQSSGEPMITLVWEIHHPDLGNALLRDNLPSKFPAKVKAFYQAVSGLTHEEMQDPANQQIEIDADELIGTQCLVQLGEREYTNKEGEKRTGKNVVGAWYFPADRVDLISFEDTPF